MNHRFYMPAEWKKHDYTLISWPVQSSMIRPEAYNDLCSAYANVIRQIKCFEKVIVMVNECDNQQKIRDLCGSNAFFLTIPHNDAWCRDNGPTFLIDKNNNLGAVNWQFNAWGEKYYPYDLDHSLASEFLKRFDIPFLESQIVLEGGSIHVDGAGTLLTTEQCLLNDNRNPSLSREKITNELENKLAIKKIIWLKKGLLGDETDGHIDNLACFVKEQTILMQTCQDPKDLNYQNSKENLDILKQSSDANEKKIKVIELPQPPARLHANKRLALSYLNFYFVNGGIILPVFAGDASDHDQEAQKILKRLFPNREIVTIDGMPLILEGGNIHCITQQIPISSKTDWRF